MGAETYYSATETAYAGHPPLSGLVETQVCIIGGGLAGLSTAYDLAKRKIPCVLLEAERIAWGASGRNGGFVSDGFALGAAELIGVAGLDRARALYAFSKQGADLVRQRINELGLRDSAMTPGYLAVWRHKARDEPERAASYMAERFDAERIVWPLERLRESLATSRYFGALENPDGFHIHPKNYAIGLAAAAKDAGAKLHEASAVTRLDLDSGVKTVFTSKGQVRAQMVVFACGGYLGRLEPRLAAAMLPIATHVVTTEAAPERVRAAIGCTQAIADTRMACDYYRVVEDSRILWGGRVTAWTAEPRDLARLMLNDLRNVYPQLADLKPEFAWSGLMSYARHRMPQIGQLQDDVWYAMGFGGHGLNTTAMAGDLVATAIAEGDHRYRLFAPFGLAWNGGALGPVAAQATYWAYQLRDRWREIFSRPAVGSRSAAASAAPGAG